MITRVLAANYYSSCDKLNLYKRTLVEFEFLAFNLGTKTTNDFSITDEVITRVTDRTFRRICHTYKK